MTVTPLPSAVVQARRWRVLLAVAAWLALVSGGVLLLIAVVATAQRSPALAGLLVLPGVALVLAGAALLPAALLVAARVRVALAPNVDPQPALLATAPAVVAPVEEDDTAELSGVSVPPAALLTVAVAVGVWWFWPQNGLPIIIGLVVAVLIALGSRRTSRQPVAVDAIAAAGFGVRTAPVEREAARLRRLAGWPQALLVAPPVLIAGMAAWWCWPVDGGVTGALGLGIAALIAAFPVLVFERRLVLTPASELPEAGALARLLRLVLWILLASGVCALAQALGASTVALWGRWAQAVLLVAVAAELLLRALSAPFLPVSGIAGARGVADSVLVGLILPRLGASAAGSGGLQDRFGIDLSQSWALRFVRQAMPGLLVALAVVAWLLSGITVLDVAERGVYERLGAPVAVLRSGLHVHLPYPFGVVQRLEFGAVHQLSLASVQSTEDAKNWLIIESLPADAPTTKEFDRMWGAPHVGDAMYAVPAVATTRDGSAQGCELLNGDARVFYRIGLDDASAQAALYRLATPEETLRMAARRLLTRAFAVRPVLSAIGEDRERLARELRTALQQQLDADGGGLEITAVSVDSVHPPSKAALTYYGVQEAGIAVETRVATARGQAFRSAGAAAADALKTRADSAVTAAELVTKARSDRTLFAAEVSAGKTSPEALRLERWLQVVGRGFERSQNTIIDHRLNLVDGPVLDLRRFAAPSALEPR